MANKEFLRRYLLDRYDPDDLVDLLNISSEELLDNFESKLDSNLIATLGLDDDEECSDQSTQD